jgi:hypothetical protein
MSYAPKWEQQEKEREYLIEEQYYVPGQKGECNGSYEMWKCLHGIMSNVMVSMFGF